MPPPAKRFRRPLLKDAAAGNSGCTESHQDASRAPGRQYCKADDMTNHTAPSELNITAHRAAASVWDRRGWDGTPEPLALSRWLVGLAASVIALEGLRQRSVKGTLLAGAGGALAWWALTGEGDLSGAQQRLAGLVTRVAQPGGDKIVD